RRSADYGWVRSRSRRIAGRGRSACGKTLRMRTHDAVRSPTSTPVRHRRVRRTIIAVAVAAACFAVVIRPARAVVVERIVAVVGDHAILLSELRGRAKPALIQIQQSATPGAQQAAAESQMFKELLEKMVQEELEAQAADRAHLTVSSDEVDRSIKTI